MTIIKKKTWPKYFNDVISKKKKFDLRLNDFDVREGDVLILEEWDPEKKEYTGRKIEQKVGYVLRFNLNDFGQDEKIRQKGLLVIQFD